MNEMVAVNGNDFDILQRVSLALFKSNYFQDVRSEAQAIAKVMAGAELGLPPFAAMAGIHIIQGKPVLGANVIATLVKNDPRYDYQITVCNERECFIGWSENGKDVGDSSFTIKEAQGAGLAGKDNWEKYPSDMLFARAISRGARRFAPGIFGGSPVYTPDEMNVEVTHEGFIDVVEVEPEETHYEMGADNTDAILVESEPSDNGNDPGESAPCDAEQVNEWRKKLASAKHITVGMLASIMANACPGRFSHEKHAANWIHKNTDLEANEQIDTDAALEIFDKATDDALVALEGEKE